MLRTFDHYYDNDQKVNISQIEKVEQEECFVCYEIKLEDKIEPIRLKMQLLYLKNCECDGTIHKKSLDMWFNSNRNCPICRNLIIKNKYALIKFMNCHKILILTYIFYKKYIYTIKKFILFFFITFLIMKLYFNIINVKYSNKYYYMNDEVYHYNNFVKPLPSINYIVPINISSKMNPNYRN